MWARQRHREWVQKNTRSNEGKEPAAFNYWYHHLPPFSLLVYKFPLYTVDTIVTLQSKLELVWWIDYSNYGTNRSLLCKWPKCAIEFLDHNIHHCLTTLVMHTLFLTLNSKAVLSKLCFLSSRLGEDFFSPCNSWHVWEYREKSTRKQFLKVTLIATVTFMLNQS
jgi:hypothetical protein